MKTKPPAVVLYVGPEEGEKRAAIESLRDSIPGGPEEMEAYSFFAFETPASEVVTLLRNGSLFGSHLFVRYRAAEQIKRKEDLSFLEEYAAHPSEHATLILESDQVRVERKLEQIVGAGNKRIFWEMFDNQKEGWVQAYVQRQGAGIEGEAVELLLELVENNTAELRMELDRLIAFVGKEITVDAVERYVYHAKEESVFTLFDAIIANDFPSALEKTGKLAATVDPGRVLGGLERQFDRLLAIHLYRQRKLPEAGLFGKQGVDMRSKRAQKSYLRAAELFPYETTRRIVMLCNEAEEALRSVPADLHYGILQQVIYSVMRREASWFPVAES